MALSRLQWSRFTQQHSARLTYKFRVAIPTDTLERSMVHASSMREEPRLTYLSCKSWQSKSRRTDWTAIYYNIEYPYIHPAFGAYRLISCALSEESHLYRLSSSSSLLLKYSTYLGPFTSYHPESHRHPQSSNQN